MWHRVPFLLSEQADPQTPLPFIRSVTARHAAIEKAGHANSDRLKKKIVFEQRLLLTGNKIKLAIAGTGVGALIA